MNVSETTERQLRAAIDRLLAGNPIRSNGNLTISALAVEAGVSRRSAARAHGVLSDFKAAIASQTSELPAETTANQAAVAALKAKLREKNAEIRDLRTDVVALANRIALLGEENRHLRAHTASIVPLPEGGRRARR